MWHYHSSETLLVGLSLLAISWKYLGSWWRVVPWLFREYTVKPPLLRNNTYIWHLWRLIEKRDMWVDILILSKSYVTEMDPSITQNGLTIHLSASAKGMLASLDYIQGWILYMDRSLKDDLRQEFFFFFFTVGFLSIVERTVFSFHLAVIVQQRWEIFNLHPIASVLPENSKTLLATMRFWSEGNLHNP